MGLDIFALVKDVMGCFGPLSVAPKDGTPAPPLDGDLTQGDLPGGGGLG
jgi:hypothetical protein